MDQNTIINELSCTMALHLSAFETQDFTNAIKSLDSLTHSVTSLESSVNALLSGIPVHPYERIKYDYFGSDYGFKTLDDLEDPIGMDHLKNIEILKKSAEDLYSTTFHNLTCCEDDKCGTAFSKMSCDKLVEDHQKQKNYIEFLEIARSIPIDSVTETNCSEIARKLLGYYTRIL